MTCKEKVIIFLSDKKSPFHIHSDKNHFTEKDINEIKFWSEQTCHNIYKYMTKSIHKYINTSIPIKVKDPNICPWHVYNSNIKK